MDRPNSVLQADSRQTHIVFGNVSGEEVSLVVSTEKGNENSKANMKERDVVVRNVLVFSTPTLKSCHATGTLSFQNQLFVYYRFGSPTSW